MKTTMSMLRKAYALLHAVPTSSVEGFYIDENERPRSEDELHVPSRGGPHLVQLDAQDAVELFEARGHSRQQALDAALRRVHARLRRAVARITRLLAAQGGAPRVVITRSKGARPPPPKTPARRAKRRAVG